ncbi:LysR family transcriptional regulator [Achromobacter aloeverae]|uniref:LysR family transcriptional regulator n=1 Tax=Achromobacter aloeverae TaxID=1750518 RepID=A0A4Q1HH85_9BURK|nr:LysR family transcriptional regulator [Achromobacter aloeverae]
MELRALKYFAEVVRLGSFTAAADALFVTQPTVSKMVQVLEDELGVPLLARDDGRRKRGVTPTDAGRRVYARAQEMLATEVLLRDDLEALGDLTRGSLTIGLPPLGASLVAPAIAAFHKQWPGVELKLLESGARAVERALREGELDVGICLAPVPDDMEGIPICDYPLHLLAPREGRWQGHSTQSSVRLADLADEPFLLYGETFQLNETIAQACRSVGFTPRLACRSSQWDLIVTLVECGMGIALLPALYGERLDRRRFVSLPISQPEIRWQLVACWRRHAQLSRAARAWVDATREFFGAAPARRAGASTGGKGRKGKAVGRNPQA